MTATIVTHQPVLAPTSPQPANGMLVFNPLFDEEGRLYDLVLRWFNEEAGALCSPFPWTAPGGTLTAGLAAGNPFCRVLADLLQQKQQTVDWQAPSRRRLRIQWLDVEGQYQFIVQDITFYQKALAFQEDQKDLMLMATTVGRRLTSLSSEDTITGLDETLEVIARYLNADRVTLLVYSSDLQHGSCNHQWNRSGLLPTMRHHRISAAQAPWWHSQMLAGNVLRIRSLDDFPAEAAMEKVMLEDLHIAAMLCIPLMTNGRTQGFLSVDSLTPRQWKESDIPVLQVLAQGMLNTWQHQQDEERLQRAHQRLKGLRAIEGAMLRNLGHSQPELAALRHLQELVPCQRLSIISVDEATGLAHLEGRFIDDALQVRPGVSFDARYLKQPNLQAGLPYSLPDIPESTEILPSHLALYEQGYRSLLILPFMQEGQLTGALVLLAVSPHFFTDEYTDIAAEVADQLALVFHQRQLSEQLARHAEELEVRVEERTQKIRELMGLQQAIFEHAGIGIMATDGEGVIQSVNPALQTLLGYSAAELVGIRTPNSLVAPERAEEQEARLHQLGGLEDLHSEQLVLAYLCRQGPLQQESTLVHKDGRLLPVLETLSPLYEGDKRLTGYIRIVTDISALKKAEDELKTTGQRLQLATQAAGLGIWEHHLTENRIVWDDRMHQINGTDPARFGFGFEDFSALIHPEDLPTFLQKRQSFLQNSDYFRDEVRIVRPDGTVCHTETLGTLVRDSNGKPVKIVGVERDITDWKEAQLALQESQQRFNEIAEMVEDVFWIRSAADLRYLYMSPAFERITGQSIAKIYEDPTIILEMIPEEDRDAMFALFTTLLSDDTTIRYRIRDRHGNLLWVQDRIYVVRDQEGKPLRLVGLATNITGEVEKQRILLESLDRERELNRLKSGFVTTVSHEFRTPLATILSSVGIIKLYLQPHESLLPKNVARHLKLIEREIEKFAGLLTDTLTLGRIEAGKVSLVLQATSLADLCQEVLETHFGNRPDNRRVELRSEGDARLVRLDRKLIDHVLVNLLTNAFKFSGGNPVLSVVFAPEHVEIQLTDDGIGIPEKDLPFLFERFFRASNAGTIPGTGLGLVIARQFVELHGGTLEVQSQLGQGSTFIIRLPVD